MQMRRSYKSTDFDRNFALLENFGLAAMVRVPLSGSLVQIYSLVVTEVAALPARFLVS